MKKINVKQKMMIEEKDEEVRKTQRWSKLIQRITLIEKPEQLNDILEETK